MTSPDPAILDALGGAPPRRVGVVMLSALGDVVHVLPVLDALKRHAPATHVTWLLQPGPAQLVEGHPCVDEIVLFDRQRGLAAYAEARRRLATRPVDLVLALQPYLKAGVLTRLWPASVKLGYDRGRARDLNWLFTTHRIPAGPRRHIQDEFFEFLDAVGVPHGEAQWRLAPADGERARARELLAADAGTGPLVGFVVATSKPQKNWMPERYAQLADRLQAELAARVVLLGGTSAIERAAAGSIAAASRSGPADLLGRGLRVTLALLEACDVVVSSDTGPFHMCVAMNVPALGLYGYTNPKRVGPYHRFADLVIDAYGDPGEDYPISMQYRPGRMARITVDDVLAKVKLALARYPRASNDPNR